MKVRKVLLIILVLCLFSVTNVYAANEWLGGGSTVSCGGINKIPSKVPQLCHTAINIVEIVVPILLVIFGAIDLVKGVISQKEDEIKKGQQTIVKRLIMGMIVFLIVALAKLLVNVAADGMSAKENIIACVNCFINGECD